MSKKNLKNRIKHALVEKMRPWQHAVEYEMELDWLSAEGLENVSTINTYTTKEELHALYRIVCKLNKGAIAVEVGSYLGASTCFISAGLRKVEGKLLCIDTWHNETMPEGNQDTMALFIENTKFFSNAISVLRKRTEALSVGELPDVIDFAFIDADHSYEAVKNDITLIAPRIRDTGVLAFHDTKHFSGVSRAVGELLGKGTFYLEGVEDNLTWLRKTIFTK